MDASTRIFLSRRRFLAALPLSALAIAGSRSATAQDGSGAILSIDPSKIGPEISPLLYGIFFEEINHAGDGGLHAEMLAGAGRIGNNGWSGFADAGGKSSLSNSGGAISVTVTGRGGIAQNGFFGLGLDAGKSYRFTAKITNATKPVSAILIDSGGNTLASATLKPGNDSAVSATLKPGRTVSDASLRLVVTDGAFTIERASLTPVDNWGTGQKLRRDLAEKVADLTPAFVRFPGGCFVEGDKLANKFDWKTTIGPAHERVANQNLWGYACSNNLGYHEYLQWCEDLRAEPLFVVNCGMSHSDIVPLDKMDAVVADALDAIEYANGDAKSTKWGRERAKNGHPKPFGLKLIQIGNENGGPAYDARYKLLFDAIKARDPGIRTVACLWGGIPRSAPIEILDEHYYNTPEFFQSQARRYDSYDRKGPKIYVGEYAVTQGCGKGNLIAALGEAFFMTGLERNADIVTMASYAPLLVHDSDRKWNPDAIVFDSRRSYGTPSYWVQKLFAQNRGDIVVGSTLVSPKAARPPETGGVGVGTWKTDAEFSDVRVNGEPVALSAKTGKWTTENGVWRQTDPGEDKRAVGPVLPGGDYTLTLKARKRGGDEGFLVLVRAKGDTDFTWWNLGGWGNTRHNIERSVSGAKSTLARDVAGKIETGRWYDIKIECAGDRIRCFLDNALVHDITLPPPPDSMASVVSREKKTGDLIVKLVNMSAAPIPTTIDLSRLPKLPSRAEGIVLTGPDPLAENSFEQPDRIAPKPVKFSAVAAKTTLVVPAWSVSILRWKA